MRDFDITNVENSLIDKHFDPLIGNLYIQYSQLLNSFSNMEDDNKTFDIN